MTATVKPRNSVSVLHLLEQGLRRHFTSTRVYDDSLVITMPGVGRVLITEDLTTMRLDFVVADAVSADASMIALERQLHAQVSSQGIDIGWHRPATVPAPLR